MRIILDPIALEERGDVSLIQTVFAVRSRAVSDGNSQSKLLAAECNGSFSAEQLLKAVNVACTAADVVSAFFRKLVESRSCLVPFAEEPT